MLIYVTGAPPKLDQGVINQSGINVRGQKTLEHYDEYWRTWHVLYMISADKYNHQTKNLVHVFVVLSMFLSSNLK